MSKILSVSIGTLLVMTGLVAKNVRAEEDPLYVGIGIGRSTVDPVRINAEPAFLVSSKDESSNTFSVTVGDQILSFMAVEISYQKLGNYEFVATSSWRTPTRLDVSFRTTALDVSVPFRFHLRRSIFPFGEVGVYRSSTKYEITPEFGSKENATDETIGYKYGIGVDVEPTESLFFRFQWRHFSDVGGVNTAYGKIVESGYSIVQAAAYVRF